MDPNQNVGGTLSRRSSHDSDEWVVVNAQGSEIDNIACQTNCEFELERRTPDEIVEQNVDETSPILRPEIFSQEPLIDEIVSLDTIESNLSSVDDAPISRGVDDDTNSQQNVSQIENDENVIEGGSFAEETFFVEDGFFSADINSSSCSSDVSLMNDAASIENDENERRVENPPDVQNVDAVPEENFVHFLPYEEVNRATRRFFVWITVGVVLGLLICQTSFLIKYLSTDEDGSISIAANHDQFTRNSDSETEFKKYQFDVNELRRQLAACKMSSKEYCERDDKPTCFKSDDVDVECKKRLEQMESYAKQFDMEHKALLDEVQELQANLSQSVSSYSQLLTVKRRESNRIRRKNKRYQLQLNDVNERLESSAQIESTLRRLLAQLESRVNSLKDDLSKSNADRDRYERLYKTSGVDDDETDGGQFSADFAKLFVSLKSSTNFDDLLNVTTSFWDGSMKKARDIYENLQKNVDDATKTAVPEVEEYLHRLKHVVVNNVGSTLSDLWQKAKDVSENLHNDCKSEFGHYCSFFNPYNEEMNDDADHVEIHTDDAEPDADSTCGYDSLDSPSDNYADQLENNYDPLETYQDALEMNQDPLKMNQVPLEMDLEDPLDLIQDEPTTASDNDRNFANDCGDDELMENLIREVKKFRTALKSTNFHTMIYEDDAEQYFDRLKRLFKNPSINFDEISWWVCQQFWWTNDGSTTTNGVDCASKYLPWQTKRTKYYYGDTLSPTKKRNLIRQSKSLTDVLNEFTTRGDADVASKFRKETSSSSNDETGSSIGSEWFFERWRNRHSIRQDERRGFDESKWIFRRSRERDEWRKNERDKKSDRGENRKQRRKRYWGGSWQTFV